MITSMSIIFLKKIVTCSCLSKAGENREGFDRFQYDFEVKLYPV